MEGSQPVLFISAKTLPEAFTRTLKAVWENGCDIATEYDRSGDPPSKDATVMIEIEAPLAEPRFHMYGGPADIVELEIYRLEVVHGVHNHWVDRYGEIDERLWRYSYHERLFEYNTGDDIAVNQIEGLIQKMVDTPSLYSRRFNVITWIPAIDPDLGDPPCLQRLHFRWLPGEDGAWVLNMNSDWRSRDLLKAWYMNVWAITDIQRFVAKKVGELRGIKTKVGRYVDKSDSLHIYGSYFDGAGSVEMVLRKLEQESPEQMYVDSSAFADQVVQARHLVAAQLESEKRTGRKSYVLPEIDEKTFPYPREWNF